MAPFRFLFLADPQLGCYATFSGMSDDEIAGFAARGLRVRPVPAVEGWAWDADRYADAVRMANELAPDLVVVGGDMVDDIAVPGQLEAYLDITARLDPAIAVHYVPGNHDIAADAVNPTAEGRAFYREAFGEDRAAFEHGGASFVIMNTVLLDRADRLPDDHRAQVAFLERALADAAARPGPTLVFGHHPIFVASPDEPRSYWSIDPPGRQAVLDLLDVHGATAVFSGHRHRNAAARYGQVELVTTSAVGLPLGDDPSGFRVVEVHEDRIEHRFVPLDDQGWD
jgi:3',5'-cyclic AMP phosphodiesterase CpdA